MLGHRPLVIDDYLAILKRRGWLVLVPALVLPIIAYAISFTIAPQYQSESLVLIEGQKVPDEFVKAVVTSDLDSRLDAIKEQLLSRSRLQPLIERYNLYPSSHMTVDDRIDAVRKDIEIRPVRSQITSSASLPGFRIIFKASDAHTAQLVCADITGMFLGENQHSRESASQGTTDFLREQLAEAKHSLDDQDAKRADFERQFMGRLPGEESPNVNMLTSLNTQLESANQELARMQQDRSLQETLLTQSVGSQAQAASSSGGGGASSAGSPNVLQLELQSLLTEEASLTSHYTSDYPDVIAIRRKISDIRREIAQTPAAPPPAAITSTAPSRFDSPAVQQMRAQLRATDFGIQEKRREQGQVQSQIRTYQERIQSSPMIAAQYKQLNRDYQTVETHYDDLLAKLSTAKMATDLEKRAQGEQFRMMDEANLPDQPFSPKRGVFAAAGVAIGLAFGIGLAALLEYRNTAMRTERDIYAFTKLPTLGVIAFTEGTFGGGRGRLSWLRTLFRSKKRSTLAEARG